MKRGIILAENKVMVMMMEMTMMMMMMGIRKTVMVMRDEDDDGNDDGVIMEVMVMMVMMIWMVIWIRMIIRVRIMLMMMMRKRRMAVMREDDEDGSVFMPANVASRVIHLFVHVLISFTCLCINTSFRRRIFTARHFVINYVQTLVSFSRRRFGSRVGAVLSCFFYVFISVFIFPVISRHVLNINSVG